MDKWLINNYTPNPFLTQPAHLPPFANNRHARTSDYMEARRGVVHWNPVLVRQVQD